MTSPVHDKERWSRFEAETEQRMRQALGDELYEWLEKEVERCGLNALAAT